MSLAALCRAPADLYEYVSLRDPAIDRDALAAPAHDPPRVWESPVRGVQAWTLGDEYGLTRDPGQLHYVPDQKPTLFRLGRLTISQGQAVRDAAGDCERAKLACRYALRDAGELVKVERERGPCGEWTTAATLDALPLWLIEELGETAMLRSALRPPLDSVSLTRLRQG